MDGFASCEYCGGHLDDERFAESTSEDFYHHVDPARCFDRIGEIETVNRYVDRLVTLIGVTDSPPLSSRHRNARIYSEPSPGNA